MRKISILLAAPCLVALISTATLAFVFAQQQQDEHADAHLRAQKLVAEGIIRTATAIASDLYSRNTIAYQLHRKKLTELQAQLPDPLVDKYLKTSESFRYPDTNGRLAVDLSDVQQAYAKKHEEFHKSLKATDEKLSQRAQVLMACMAVAFIAFGGTLAIAVIGVRRIVAQRSENLRSHGSSITEVVPSADESIVEPAEVSAREQHIQQLAEAAKSFATQPPDSSH